MPIHYIDCDETATCEHCARDTCLREICSILPPELLAITLAYAANHSDTTGAGLGFASECGDLRLVCWLQEHFSRVMFGAYCDPIYALTRACVGGHQSVAERLVTHYGIGAEDVYSRGCGETPLSPICLSGQVETAQWLVKLFGMPPRASQCIHALRSACGSNSVRMVGWLACSAGLSIPEAMPVFDYACQLGKVGAARSLADAFHISAKDLDASGYSALRLASECGSSSVVKWIVRRFEPSRLAVARSGAVLEAAGRGYLSLAKWLMASCGMRSSLCLLVRVCQNGHLKAAVWFATELRLAGRNVDGCAALKAACAHGHLDIAKKISAIFPISALHVRECGLLQAALPCRALWPDIIRWIITEFNLNYLDVCAARTLSLAYTWGPLELAKWLVERFDLRGHARGIREWSKHSSTVYPDHDGYPFSDDRYRWFREYISTA